MNRRIRYYCPECQCRRETVVDQYAEAIHCRYCRMFINIPKPAFYELWWFGIKEYFGRFRQPQRKLVYSTRSDGVLFGGWSDDPSSDLYVRPDKDHPNERARHLKRAYHKIEQLETEGKTPRLKDVCGESDFQDVKERIAYYENKDRTI